MSSACSCTSSAAAESPLAELLPRSRGRCRARPLPSGRIPLLPHEGSQPSRAPLLGSGLSSKDVPGGFVREGNG